ncbi:MAG: hypothetical protein IPJ78_15770 [Gemmatimonadetes bacterium]|nr:hypothetical protein [Gemmatimonadota bacterium]
MARKADWSYVAIAVLTLLVVVLGFGRTYALPMVNGTFGGPRVLHLHGAFALAWVLLFVAQPLLVRTGRRDVHRRLGRLGVPIAIGVVLTMLPAGAYQVTRDLAAGVGPSSVSAIVGVVTSGVLFLTLVSLGIGARADRDAHARWLLLATLVVAWPAWFRLRHWFPGVPRPEIWFALVLPYLWVGVAMLRDRLSRGSVHPVLSIAGSAVVLEQSLEAVVYDTPPWRAMADVLYGWLHA